MNSGELLGMQNATENLEAIDERSPRREKYACHRGCRPGWFVGALSWGLNRKLYITALQTENLPRFDNSNPHVRALRHLESYGS
jgi:hypothetical protein